MLVAGLSVVCQSLSLFIFVKTLFNGCIIQLAMKTYSYSVLQHQILSKTFHPLDILCVSVAMFSKNPFRNKEEKKFFT